MEGRKQEGENDGAHYYAYGVGTGMVTQDDHRIVRTCNDDSIQTLATSFPDRMSE